MKLQFKKVSHPCYGWTSVYAIALDHSGGSEPLGFVMKSYWATPSRGIRWEFKAPLRGDRHPLANQYPDTLADAKVLVEMWLLDRCKGILETEPFGGRHRF